jgi:hypothetical protein
MRASINELAQHRFVDEPMSIIVSIRCDEGMVVCGVLTPIGELKEMAMHNLLQSQMRRSFDE